MNNDELQAEVDDFVKHVGAPSFKEAVDVLLRTKQQDEDKISEMFEIIKSTGVTNSKLAAEIAELKEDVDRLTAARDEANESVTLNYNTILELRQIITETKAELDICRSALGIQIHEKIPKQTPTFGSILVDSVGSRRRIAPATENEEKMAHELEAARKERDELATRRVREQMELGGETARAIQQRDTALAAKDAAERAIEWLSQFFEYGEVDFDESEQRKIYGWMLDDVEIASALDRITGKTDVMPTLRDTLRAALAPAPTQEPPAGGVTISTEKKGGEAGMFIESPPMKGASDVRPEGRPADVPTGGRGELLPFDLEQALTGARIVTRDGREVKRIEAGEVTIDVWTDRDAFSVWGHGRYRVTGEHPLDLFMLPTEGSGA